MGTGTLSSLIDKKPVFKSAGFFIMELYLTCVINDLGDVVLILI
jgi:hypothetical protein